MSINLDLEGLGFYQSTTGETLNDTVVNAMISTRREVSVDRFSAPLPSGKSVSAALKLSGRGRHLLEITIDPEGGILWPPPPIHEKKT